MKKVISLVLSVAMLLSVAVMASAETTEIRTVGTNEVELVATVAEDSTLMSVIMPTSIDFVIGTTHETSGDFADGFRNANKITGGYKFSELYCANATVTNNSKEDIKLELVDVRERQGNLLNLVKLGLWATGMQENDVLDDHRLEVGMAAYTLAETIQGTDSTATSSGGSVALKVIGKAAFASIEGVQYPVSIPSANYTIVTTLKVSLADT